MSGIFDRCPQELSEHKPYFTEKASAVVFARFEQNRNKQNQDETAGEEGSLPAN